MTGFRIEIVQDVEEARKLWVKWSPGRSLYDDWDFRSCFNQYFNYPIHFLVGYNDDIQVGILPLQFNSEKKYLEAFGGSYMRNLCVYTKNEYRAFIPEFYKSINSRAKIVDIDSCDVNPTLLFHDFNYTINLSEIKSIDGYLNKFLKSKERTNIKRRFKLMDSKGLFLKKNKAEDLKKLFELNKKNFKDASTFHFPFREKIFFNLFKKNFGNELNSFYFKDDLVCVSFAIFYKKIFYYINLGVEKDIYPHAWSFITLFNIKRSIELGATLFDAGMGDFGWKEKWGFEKKPQYEFNN